MVDVATFHTRTRRIFADVDVPCVEDALAEAARWVGEKAWANLYEDGIVYFAAHLLTELAQLEAGAKTAGAQAGGSAVPAGPVTQERILNWSASYATEAFSRDALATTSWGRMYLARRQLVFGSRCI